MPNSLTRRLIIAVAGVLLALVLGGIGYRHYLVHTANSLLEEVKALRIGKSDFAEAITIARKYRRFRIYGNASVPASVDPAENVFPENICTPDRCFFEFVIDNRPLSNLRIIHAAAFTAAFAVLHGKVQYVTFRLVGGPSPGVFGGIVEELSVPSDLDLRTFPASIPAPYVFVRLTPSTPNSIREHAFALNLNCLASAGCAEPCDYLPQAWKDWTGELGDNEWGAALHAAYPRCP